MAMAQKNRLGGGSKLSRSETVTVRLDPKLQYLAGVAARKQRRTLSSFIEWAVEQSLHSVNLYIPSVYGSDEPVSVEDEATRLWVADEAERFARLAILYPELMTHEEQEKWLLLSDSGLFSDAKKRSSSGHVYWNWPFLEDRLFPSLRLLWPEFEQAFAGGQEARRQWLQNIQKTTLPANPVNTQQTKTQIPSDDLDDTIPF